MAGKGVRVLATPTSYLGRILACMQGDIISLVAGMDYSSKHALAKHRVKQLAYICMKAVHQNRNQLKDQLFAAPEEATTSTTLLLEALVLLIDPKLPWVCETVGYLLQRKAFILYREIILTGKSPFSSRQSPRGIFCSHKLNLRSISAIGYDMDYTFMHYNVIAWEGRAYDYCMENLKKVGFPVDGLAFDPDLVIRGLVIDRERKLG